MAADSLSRLLWRPAGLPTHRGRRGAGARLKVRNSEGWRDCTPCAEPPVHHYGLERASHREHLTFRQACDTVAQTRRSDLSSEDATSLLFTGIDPNTGGGGSPTVWVDDENWDILVQSTTADGATITKIGDTEWVPGHAKGVPAHESVIRIPSRMVPILRKACDVAEQRAAADGS
ncbi:hypothetical protein [Kitasatospora sp. NBC_01250]|uniref:hypothetical protein n=1 Tax=Kitasatospora sp. NBC_01250 TaxID=2903571 RepID=UPI003FA5836C